MFERPDWTLFRTVEGLMQKAGVPAGELRRLVLKELGDNALDTGSRITYGRAKGDKYYIEDDGPGLDGAPEEIAELYSIARPLRSTKLLRKPQRGQLGNGLRVVAGAVLASGGSLAVITRNRRIVLRPEADGSTSVIKAVEAAQPIGTRVEISFGRALPDDDGPFAWLQSARAMAGSGQFYEGKSSPFWYDGAQFHELLLACRAQPVRALIAELEGCTGSKAGEIVGAAKLDRLRCQDVDREQAIRLLKVTRANARPVGVDRLGYVGRDAFPDHSYAKESGIAELGTVPQAQVPHLAEVWACKVGFSKKETDTIDVSMLVNRTPITAEVSAWRDSSDGLNLQGAGLWHSCANVPKKGPYALRINLITPYCPITSDGKEPDLALFAGAILAAIEAAMRKAQRAAPAERKVSQKDVVLDNLDDAIAAVSEDDDDPDHKHRFNERQILYRLRPIVLEQTGKVLTTKNFKSIITDYENEHGEIPGMYREIRGSLYEPHTGSELPLGTLSVEKYERPAWTYNNVVFIEKEGWSEALKEVRWPEQHDCMLMSCKGFTTRAAKDLVDKLAAHDEPVTIFCVHDADAYGTMIYQTFQNATKARAARKIEIVNLGLEPWEAVGAGFDVERVPQGDQRKPVADYVRGHEDGPYWDYWLQTHRVELNVMSTAEFIAWLDGKMAEHDTSKLVPPEDVIASELENRLEAKVRAVITDRILRKANVDAQVAAALAGIERPSTADLTAGIKRLFKRQRDRQWRDHVEATANALSPQRNTTAP